MTKELLPKNVSSYIIKRALLLICILAFSSQLFAHGDLSLRIENKTTEIKEDPKNALLYFERGFLYQQHEEFKKALSDYIKSEELGYTSSLVPFRKSQVYFNQKELGLALNQIDTYIDSNNLDIKGKKLKAQILFKLKRYSEAIPLYDYVIKNTIDIRPQDFIEYCNIILSENTNDYQKAIDILDFGLTKVGKNALSLRLKRLDFLKASNQVNKTIEEYNYFILEYNRNEFWYYKKAKYLESLKRLPEANISIQSSKIAINQLDNKFKNTPSIKKLKENIISLEQKINNSKS